MKQNLFFHAICNGVSTSSLVILTFAPCETKYSTISL